MKDVRKLSMEDLRTLRGTFMGDYARENLWPKELMRRIKAGQVDINEDDEIVARNGPSVPLDDAVDQLTSNVIPFLPKWMERQKKIKAA